MSFQESTPNPDSDLQTEAMLLWHSISLQALEELVTKLADEAFRFQGSKSKSAADFLHSQRDANIRNILRHLSDQTPARASKLQEMLLKMNGGQTL